MAKSGGEGGTRFLRVEDIRSRLGVSDRYFRYLRSSKGFPAPDVKLGKAVLWTFSTWERWCEEQVATGGTFKGRRGSKAAAAAEAAAKDSAAR
jgi:predicted DNA-binding transcriptional regulator AlpA